MDASPSKLERWTKPPILVGLIVFVVLVVAVIVSVSTGAWSPSGDGADAGESAPLNMADLAGDYVSDADSGWRMMLSDVPDPDSSGWSGSVRMYSPTLKLYDGGKQRCRLVDQVLEVEFRKGRDTAVVRMFDVVDAHTLGLKLTVAAFPGYMKRPKDLPAPSP